MIGLYKHREAARDDTAGGGATDDEVIALGEISQSGILRGFFHGRVCAIAIQLETNYEPASQQSNRRNPAD